MCGRCCSWFGDWRHCKEGILNIKLSNYQFTNWAGIDGSLESFVVGKICSLQRLPGTELWKSFIFIGRMTV